MALSWLVVDASRYQTFTDYSEAAASVDGVILRCGIRGYTSGALSQDSKLDVHYNGFFGKTSKLDIPIRIGYYWYTCAISDEEAREEATYIHNILNGKWNDFPIYINSDYGSEEQDGRADQLTPEERTQYLCTLGEELLGLGYRIGIYATDDWLQNQLVYETIQETNFHIWDATDDLPTAPGYEAWRYTAEGTIPGISSRVSLTNFYADVANWANTQININTLETWIVSPVTYNGTLETDTMVGIEGLTYLTDYMVQFCNASAASTLAYALLEGINKYTGTKSLHYVIEPADIHPLNIQLEKDGYKYTGEEIKPRIVYDTSTDLGRSFSSSQYNITYQDNIWPGQGTVIITGKNNYKGTIELHFYIEGQVPFPYHPYLDEDEFIYTGEEITPKVIIGTLKEGEDFTVEYSDNLNVGTAHVVITGINNYEGDVRELDFIIKPLNISETGNVRYLQSRYEYTGDPIFPTFTMTASLGDRVYNLVDGSDYSFYFKNNTVAGNGTTVVEGYGNYTGIHYSNFKIEPAPISDCTVTLEGTKFEYTGDPIEPEVYVDFHNHPMGYGNFNVTYSNNIKVGTAAMVTVTGKNNLTGVYKTTFEITTKTGDDFWMLDQAEFVYNGQEFKPNPICMNDDPVIGRDYTVEYENNINAGIGKCIVTMIGNYTYKKVYLSFRIYPQPIEANAFAITETEFIYKRAKITPEITCNREDYILGTVYSISYKNNYYPEEDAQAVVRGIGNYTDEVIFPFHIARVKINEIAYIDMGEPVKYDVYDPANFKVMTNTGEELVIYDDYIYDFKTITFEKNTTYQYTVYIVTGIGPCTGTIVKGYRTSVPNMTPEIPNFVPKAVDLVVEEVEDDVATVIVTDEEEEHKFDIPVYVDPYAKSSNFIEDIEPIIPDDPEEVEYHSGQWVYMRKCKYYSSAYTKFSEADILDGTLFVYSYKEVNGRIRITLDPRNAKIIGRTMGWIDVDDIREFFSVKVGDKVIIENYIWSDREKLEGRIFKKGKEMYVTYVDPELSSTSEVGIAVSNKPNLSGIGWVSIDMIDLATS